MKKVGFEPTKDKILTDLQSIVFNRSTTSSKDPFESEGLEPSNIRIKNECLNLLAIIHGSTKEKYTNQLRALFEGIDQKRFKIFYLIRN